MSDQSTDLTRILELTAQLKRFNSAVSIAAETVTYRNRDIVAELLGVPADLVGEPDACNYVNAKQTER